MSAPRTKLQETLHQYVTETVTYIITVREFCTCSPIWMVQRKMELEKMMAIKTKAQPNQGTEEENKGKAELEKELEATLETMLQGLKELDSFSDALEKLAVTSCYVFLEENRVLHLGVGLEFIMLVVMVVRIICPQLLEFRRDASVFFQPRLQNLEVLALQLEKYMEITQKICDTLEIMFDSFNDFDPNELNVEVSVELPDLTENDIQNMLDHIVQLEEIRMNPSSWMVFLFQDELCSSFVQKFNERRPRMLKFLEELEDTAVQLDRMNKGAKISSVVGSSVGVVGGILSIVGLALIPVTAGVSLALTMTGLGMGIGSGANAMITTATEMGVNNTQQNRANELFKSFKEDVEDIQESLEDAINTASVNSAQDVAAAVGTITAGVGSVVTSILSSVPGVKIIKITRAIAEAGEDGIISSVRIMGQVTAKSSLALSRVARASLIGVNVLFVGLDIFFICKDSISLAKGSETVLSQFIRARAALWSSEIDAWEKIHDDLTEGQAAAKQKQELLEKPFYPELK